MDKVARKSPVVVGKYPHVVGVVGSPVPETVSGVTSGHQQLFRGVVHVPMFNNPSGIDELYIWSTAALTDEEAALDIR